MGGYKWTIQQRAKQGERMRQAWVKRRNQTFQATNPVTVLESKIDALRKQVQTLEQAKAILTGAN